MSYQARAVRPYPHQRRHVVVVPHNAEWCALGQIHCVPYGTQTFTNSWTTGNTAVGFWITAPYDCTIYRIGWYNGSAAGGDTDVAIYDSDGTTRLVSTGATTCTGNNIWQFVDTTDQALTAGKDYFVATNHSANTSGQMIGMVYSVGLMTLGDMKQQAVGATTLPDPFVPVAPTNGRFVLPVALMLTDLGTS